mgnify:CR=1 FL=1
MAPRLPVETRRSEETGNNEARCRNQCRQWKEIQLFAPREIEKSSFNCKQCMANKHKKWRTEVRPNRVFSKAEKLYKIVRSREDARKLRVELSVSDVEKLIAKYGGKCVLSGSDEDLRIGRIVPKKPLPSDNAVIITKKIERLVYDRDPLWGRVFHNVIPKLQILGA